LCRDGVSIHRLQVAQMQQEEAVPYSILHFGHAVRNIGYVNCR
jgi:hypothetical protein